MKRHLRTVRGPKGLKGEDGLSAYGVWLKAGNTGTKEDFFRVFAAKALHIHGKDRPNCTHWPGN